MTTYLTGEHHWPAALSNGADQPQVRAELPAALLDRDGLLIDWLVGFTLGTLDGQHAEIRVLPALSDRVVVASTHYPYPLSPRVHSEVP
jgi:hypothetical protein